MSNKICLVATKFENVAQNGETTHGFRMYGDYIQAYDNTSESPILDDLELLEWAIDNHPPKLMSQDFIAETLGEIKYDNLGMEINGVWYDWIQIKDCF